jgi:hypothetical protein
MLFESEPHLHDVARSIGIVTLWPLLLLSFRSELSKIYCLITNCFITVHFDISPFCGIFSRGKTKRLCTVYKNQSEIKRTK